MYKLSAGQILSKKIGDVLRRQHTMVEGIRRMGLLRRICKGAVRVRARLSTRLLALLADVKTKPGRCRSWLRTDIVSCVLNVF